MDELVLEGTRRCNMKCGHCLRGCAQNIDMPSDVVEKFLQLNQVDNIGTLVFSGGEPSLNPGFIRKIVEVMDNCRVSVESFYIATNGKARNMEFFMAIAELFAFISQNTLEPDMSGLEISRSYWHEQQGQDEDWIETLKAFRFTKERTYLDYDFKGLLKEGRATKETHAYRKVDKHEKFEIDAYADGRCAVNGLVYLNAQGQVLGNCDLSYASQRRYALGYATQDRLMDIAKAAGTLTIN